MIIQFMMLTKEFAKDSNENGPFVCELNEYLSNLSNSKYSDLNDQVLN